MTLSRRKFLLYSGISLSSAMIAPTLRAETAIIRESKTLNVSNIHTGESAQCEYLKDKVYQDAGLNSLNRICRDFRRNETAQMDPKLFIKLSAILDKLEAPQANIHIVSGYRSPATNAMLRKGSSAVAKKSFHMKGQAIDFFVEGIAVSQVHKAAMSLRSGGVGRYRDFVHIDTGPTRAWG
ncbi:DUF882 domain-containing protein [Motilimonas pumila]|uniref:Murein endopeptidase K n=2 Tax=Motilimonas pumila TaxID=2303987 RepID=A0A418YD64_9GAMM|nr:DUF882 domain-containing protein [Motilimonas pumila]